MDTLTALFGSETKVKLLRLFLFNGEIPFLPKELAYRTKSAPSQIKKEVNVLMKADIIRRRNVLKNVEGRQGDKIIFKKAKGTGYLLNKDFPYLESLKNLLTVASLNADENFTKRFSNVGKIKLMIASGVFIQNWDSRVDLLIVGEDLNQNRIETIIKLIESEIGKEISYSAFETSDFEYRLGIHDRLVRDILDYSHVTLVDKLGIDNK